MTGRGIFQLVLCIAQFQSRREKPGRACQRCTGGGPQIQPLSGNGVVALELYSFGIKAVVDGLVQPRRGLEYELRKALIGSGDGGDCGIQGLVALHGRAQ